MRKRLLKRCLIVLCAVLAAVAAAAIGSHWLMPALIAQRISSSVEARWDGTIEFAGVDFDWFGPIRLRGVDLSDRRNRSWLHAESVELTLANWPGLHPVLTGVEADGLEIRARMTGRKLLLPIKPSSPGAGAVDIRRLAVKGMSLAVANEDGTQIALGGIELTVARKGGDYDVALHRAANDPTEVLSVVGTIKGEPAEADLSLVLKHQVSRQEGEVLLAMTGAPLVQEVSGKIDAACTVRGPLGRGEEIATSGVVTLGGWNALVHGQALVKGMAGTVNLEGTGPPGATGQLSAEVCDGKVDVSLRVDDVLRPATSFSVVADGEGIDFAALTEILTQGERPRQGRFGFRYSVMGAADGEALPSGRGWVFLDDCDLTQVRLLSHLIGMLGVPQLDRLVSTDAEAVFRTAGPVVTIEKAQLANAVSAVEVEPGGRIDLASHHLDLYAVALPIKEVHQILSSLPLVKLVVQLKDRLVRVHVRGDWDRPPAELITKEPVKDIGEGTVEFFRGVATTGGNLSGKLLGVFHTLFPK